MSIYAAGRPILKSELPLPDRLLLWSMRAWVIGLKQRLDVAEPTRSAFGRYDIPEAAELIDALMCIVVCGAGRTLIVECVCHKGLSEDERHLLTAAALRQQGRSLEACFLLRSMLSANASADAGEILDRLGALLASAGLRLFKWPRETERYAFEPVFGAETKARRVSLH